MFIETTLDLFDFSLWKREVKQDKYLKVSF